MLDLSFVKPPDLSPPFVHEVVVNRYQSSSWDMPLSSIAEAHLLTMDDKALDADWKLNEFFGTIAVINLPYAKKRLSRISEELQGIGVKDFEVFSAIDGKQDLPPSIWRKMIGNRENYNGKTNKGKKELEQLHQAEAGCFMSHYKLIQAMKNKFEDAMAQVETALAFDNKKMIEEGKKKLRKYSRVLILEDDTGFGMVSDNLKSIFREGGGRILREALLQLPIDWDILFLNVEALEPSTPVFPHLCKMGLSRCTAAYAINYPMYTPLVNLLKKIEDPKEHWVYPVDIEISITHSKYEVYAINPSIAFHQNGFSTISGKKNHLFWQGQPVIKK